MPILWRFFDWISNNKWAQTAIAIIGAFSLYKVYERIRDIRIRGQERTKIEIKAQEASRKVIARAEEKTDEVIRKADEARADIPSGTPSGELPDEIQSVLFGNRGKDRSGD